MTSTTTGKFVIEASEFDGTRQIVPKEIPVAEDADSFQAVQCFNKPRSINPVFSLFSFIFLSN